MKRLIFVCLMVLSQLCFAAITGDVIEVQRKLKQLNEDPTPAKDYFINLGERNGLRTGDILEVSRVIPVVDRATGGPWHLMEIRVGEIRVYAVGESSCVGQMYQQRAPNQLAMEHQDFMLGDKVTLKTGLPFD